MRLCLSFQDALKSAGLGEPVQIEVTVQNSSEVSCAVTQFPSLHEWSDMRSGAGEHTLVIPALSARCFRVATRAGPLNETSLKPIELAVLTPRAGCTHP